MTNWIFKLLKDRLEFIIGYILNSFFLISFFYLVEDKQEFLYPVIISLFIFGAILVVALFKYVPFNSSLKDSISNAYYDLKPKTEEQINVNFTIKKIHQYYLNMLYETDTKIAEKEHFLSHWIHNIKTPVSVIDLIIQKAVSNQIDLHKGIDEIKQENTRIYHHLEQVLNVMRLGDFSRDYTPKTINLVDNLNQLINYKKNQFIYNRVFPRLEIPNDNVLVLSDEKWNLLLLEQIISNAIKYSKSESKSKYISFKIIQNQNKTILTIRDEGIGIPSYDIPKIFEPFFTGENGRKYQDATGIGLYICSKIAEKLGHTISIESNVGEGTTVTISYLSKM